MFRHHLAAQFHRRPEIELLVHDQRQREHPRHQQIDARQYQAEKSQPGQQAGDKSGEKKMQKRGWLKPQKAVSTVAGSRRIFFRK